MGPGRGPAAWGAPQRTERSPTFALPDLAANDAEVMSLGSASYEGPTPTDLPPGGRFREDRLVGVRATIARHGGAIVADDLE
jgi:hypothetical protein